MVTRVKKDHFNFLSATPEETMTNSSLWIVAAAIRICNQHRWVYETKGHGIWHRVLEGQNRTACGYRVYDTEQVANKLVTGQKQHEDPAPEHQCIVCQYELPTVHLLLKPEPTEPNDQPPIRVA